MTTIDDFLDLIRDELGLAVSAQDAALDLDQVAGWDSVYLLALLTQLERRTGRSLPFAEVLQAASLNDIYALVAK